MRLTNRRKKKRELSVSMSESMYACEMVCYNIDASNRIWQHNIFVSLHFTFLFFAVWSHCISNRWNLSWKSFFFYKSIFWRVWLFFHSKFIMKSEFGIRNNCWNVSILHIFFSRLCLSVWVHHGQIKIEDLCQRVRKLLIQHKKKGNKNESFTIYQTLVVESLKFDTDIDDTFKQGKYILFVVCCIV